MDNYSEFFEHDDYEPPKPPYKEWPNAGLFPQPKTKGENFMNPSTENWLIRISALAVLSMLGFWFFYEWGYEEGTTSALPMAYRAEDPPSGNLSFYVDRNVRLTYDKDSNLILATTVETYDVAPGITDEFIWYLMNTLQNRAEEQYFGGNQFLPIVKRIPNRKS